MYLVRFSLFALTTFVASCISLSSSLSILASDNSHSAATPSVALVYKEFRDELHGVGSELAAEFQVLFEWVVNKKLGKPKKFTLQAKRFLLKLLAAESLTDDVKAALVMFVNERLKIERGLFLRKLVGVSVGVIGALALMACMYYYRYRARRRSEAAINIQKMWKGFSLRQNMQLQDFVILPKEASSLRLSEQSQSIAGVGCGAAEGDTNAGNLKDFIQDSIAPILQSIKLLSVSSYQKAYRSVEEYGFCCVHNIRVGLKARELQARQRLVLKQKFPQEPSKVALRRMKNSHSLQRRTDRWEELVIQELRKFGGVNKLARVADSALMVSFKKFDQSREVVLKIPNPYAFYEHTELWFGDPFWLGESRSPRRNVHRVSVAQKLLRGPLIDSRRIRVPQKFLVARQGYVPAMPINDATMIIVSEKAPLIKYEDIEMGDYRISDEDGSFLWQVIKESGSYDMHIQNVGVDTDKNLWMYDLEKPQVNKACSLQNLLYIPLTTYLSNYMKIPLVKAALKDGDFDANQKLWAVNFLLDRNEAAQAWFTAMNDLVAVFNNVPDVTGDMRDKVKTKFDEVRKKRLGGSCYSQGLLPEAV